MTILGIALSWLLGGALWRVAWPGRGAPRHFLLSVGGSLLLGLAVSSVIFFATAATTSRPLIPATALEAALTLLLFGWRVCRPAATDPVPASGRARLTPLDWLLATALLQVAVVAGVLAWRSYQAEPYGGWDGWAIWNLHARFLSRAGPGWREVLAAPELSWTHPDYPWLVPAAVARAWAWRGAETPGASAMISSLFAAASVALLLGLTARLRSRPAGLLGALLLLGTPFFVTFSTNEHADLPLAAFMLAAVGLAALVEEGGTPPGAFFLAGLCAGFAAWTKNEGLLFALVFGAVLGARTWRRGSSAGALPLFAGLALGLAPVVGFKLLFAPGNDLLAAPWGPRLAQLVDLGRHRIILAALGRDLLHFGEWQPAPFLAMLLPFAAWRKPRPPLGTVTLVATIVGLMLAGFYLVYLLTPQDLAWHLDTSLVRLLLQLWPLVLFGWGLALPEFAAVPVASNRPRWLPGLVFAGANLVCAGLLLALLARQPAPNELAVWHHRSSTVAVVTSADWHPVEHAVRQRWAWSRGNASLLLHASALPPDHPVILKFRLRSVAPRRVSIALQGRELWTGELRGEFVAVALPPLTLTTSPLTLDFTTDAPATPEVASGGGRALAFAVYDVQIK
jgi:hypothetical protein